jgi:hypothetical protein
MDHPRRYSGAGSQSFNRGSRLQGDRPCQGIELYALASKYPYIAHLAADLDPETAVAAQARGICWFLRDIKRLAGRSKPLILTKIPRRRLVKRPAPVGFLNTGDY